ncbi:hypothetical protein [Ideonella sp.]|uniref:hypothetical protein n=1 Tax=Ideonella sp. TaxID=1929293 RepID=UPI003BB509CE
MSRWIHALAAATLTAASSGVLAQVAAAEVGTAADNGTDPTKLNTSASVQYEHIAEGHGETGTFKLSYALLLSEKRDYSLRFWLPVARRSGQGVQGEFGVGNVSVQLTHVFGLSRTQGFVAQGEVEFDRAVLSGSGIERTVLKGSMIYARFLAGGDLFAPAVVHSQRVGGGDARDDLSRTVFDFYYVPKLADTKTFVTVDPALNSDWKSDKHYASLAVTVGRVLGPALGGNAQVSIKPSVFAGGQRPANWGLEAGFKVIGF